MQSWQKLLKNLIDSKLEFFLVGGAGLVLHGLPRTTLDADIYIPANSKNFKIVFELLCDDLSLISENISLRNHYNNVKLFVGQWFSFANDDIDIIDVYLDEPENFYSLLNKCDKINFMGRDINVLSLLEIKKMKKVAGRPLDLADIALIDEILEI